MDINYVVDRLKQDYPGKKIILNNKNNLTEILCEVDPTNLHPTFSIAVAVVDQSLPHYHKKTTENYEVLKGELILDIDGHKHILKQGQKMEIQPGEIHFANGNETWIKVTSRPGWTKEDHRSHK